MRQKVEDFIKSSCHLVEVSGAQIWTSHQCGMLALSSRKCSPPDALTRSACCSDPYEPDSYVSWQCHSLAKLDSSGPSPSLLAAACSYSADTNHLWRCKFRVTWSGLNSSDENNAEFTAGAGGKQGQQQWEGLWGGRRGLENRRDNTGNKKCALVCAYLCFNVYPK